MRRATTILHSAAADVTPSFAPRPLFADRADAGRQLAARLEHLRGRDVVVLGLPRGGVPVAAEIAHALEAPLDVVLVRKVGVPFQPELAMAAVGEDAVVVTNLPVLQRLGFSDDATAVLVSAAAESIDRQSQFYRASRPREPIAGRTAVVVDDGIATGATARAACEVLRHRAAGEVVLATPVAAPECLPMLTATFDEVVVVATPSWLSGVGEAYGDFRQLDDADVVRLLVTARGTAFPDQ